MATTLPISTKFRALALAALLLPGLALTGCTDEDVALTAAGVAVGAAIVGAWDDYEESYVSVSVSSYDISYYPTYASTRVYSTIRSSSGTSYYRYRWSIVSGPAGGAAIIGSPSAPSTDITFTAPGEYTVRYEVWYTSDYGRTEGKTITDTKFYALWAAG